MHKHEETAGPKQYAVGAGLTLVGGARVRVLGHAVEVFRNVPRWCVLVAPDNGEWKPRKAACIPECEIRLAPVPGAEEPETPENAPGRPDAPATGEDKAEPGNARRRAPRAAEQAAKDA